MTAQSPIKPTTPEHRLAAAAAAYAEAVLTDPMDKREATKFLRLALCEAFDDVVPAGAHEEIDDLRWRLNIDEEGNPLDDNGWPERTFNPSRVHPNDLCQSKGYY